MRIVSGWSPVNGRCLPSERAGSTPSRTGRVNATFPIANLLLIICTLSFFSSCGQVENQIRVRGEFLVDSIKIGSPFPYALSARYPVNLNVLFPDSTYKFEPFEFAVKKYFPTKTIDGVSFDSTIYYLSSFEIDSVQSLKLPVFVVQVQDCTSVWTEPDQVWLQHLVTLATDSIEATKLPLKVNTFYEPVAWLFNYPLASFIGGTVIVLLVVGWLIFGKRIRKYFKMRRMRKSFEKYLNTFNDSLETLKANYSIGQAEKTLSVWKKYLENLENKPITKFTSKEILQATKHETLAAPLRMIDRMLYASLPPSSFDAFYELKSYSEDCYYKKIEEVKRPTHEPPMVENSTPVLQNG